MIESLFASEPTPTQPPADSDFWYVPVGRGSTAGERRIRATPDFGMYLSSVYACVKVIAETVAQLPLVTYRRLPNGGRVRATDISLYRLLHDQPNGNQTSFEFREMMTGHVLLRGNAFAEIKSDRRNAVASLEPLHPDRVEVKRLPSGRRVYFVDEGTGGVPRRILQDDMFHIRGLSFDGVSGVSVIEYAAGTIAAATAMEEHGSNLFANAAQPSGILSHPMTLSDPASERLGRQFDKRWGGSANAGRTMVLEEGLKWEQVGLSMIDAEWLAGQKFALQNVARFFRMQLHMIGDLERSTNNNIEQQGHEFIMYTMLPWFRRWEGAISRDLILAPAVYYSEFLVDGILRGKLLDRFQTYKIGREIGVYNPDEIRELENMNAREDPGGKEYLTPLNMSGSDDPPAPGEAPAPAQPAPGPRIVRRSAPRKRAASDREQTFARAAAHDAAGRILRIEVNEARKAAVKHAKDPAAWEKWAFAFYAEHAQHVAAVLHVTAEAAAKYAVQRADDLVKWGAACLETWEADHAEQLVALALKGE